MSLAVSLEQVGPVEGLSAAGPVALQGGVAVVLLVSPQMLGARVRLSARLAEVHFEALLRLRDAAGLGVLGRLLRRAGRALHGGGRG